VEAEHGAPRVAAVETLRHPDEPGLVHVLVTDGEGTTGLGETHGHAGAVAALLAELGPALAGLAATPAAVAAVTGAGPYGSRRPGGPVSVESRAASALDIALHDLAARRRRVALADLLGGRARGEVPVYTTCTGRDHEASLADPERLAHEVAADGFGLVKVWPFAPGRDAGADVERVRRLATAGGPAVAVDLVGLFAGDEAAGICRLLDPLGLAWIEDPLPDGAGAALAALAATLATPVCTGERLAGADAFARLLDEAAPAIVHVDVAWCGGVGVAVEVARRAAATGARLALHDVSGPVALATSVHVAAHVAGDALVECSRVDLRERYARMAEGVPAAGPVLRPAGPGHGVTLAPSYVAGAESAACRVRR
jgi:L-alanine-DL-glutamate epimerase-like enolase superfamily enzyme